MANSGWSTSVTDGRSFDHHARLVRRILRVPVALVTLVEADRQVFCGLDGLEGPYAAARQTPLSHSFCQYVVADEKPLIITDARLETRLADNLAIRDLEIIAYAGWPLLDEAGTTVGSLCAIDSSPRDWTAEDLETLSDLAQACSAELQARLRQAQDGEDLLRTLFDTVGAAMAFYDADHRLVIANKQADAAAAAAGFRLDTPPYAGVHVRRSDNRTLIPSEDQFIPRALRGELEGHEMEWIGPLGRQLAVVASAQQVRRSDGSMRGTLVAAHDVTELARSLKVKDDFITTVSHELRTPLTSILGYLEVVSDEVAPQDAFLQGALDTIRRNALRLLERVQQLLETGDRRRQIKMQATDVSALARSVVTMFTQEAQQAGIELCGPSGEPVWATVDAGQVERALENLVSNALRYTGSGGRVTVRARTLDGAGGLTVEDTGAGMSPDEVEQACDTFWRSESVLEAALPGVGLGLTLVREIVDAHGGTLDIDSVVGVGTTVTLTF